MQPYIYKVFVENVERNVLSLLEPDLVFKNGIKNSSFIGFILNTSLPLKKDNVYINPNFISLFHKVVKEISPTSELFIETAEKQRQGFVYVIDQRDKNYPNTKPYDIIGAFEVKDGTIVISSYAANPNYQIVSEDGLFQLPAIYYKKLILAMHQ